MKKVNLGSFLVASTALPTACSMLYTQYATRKLNTKYNMSEEERRKLRDRVNLAKNVTKAGTTGLIVSTTLQQLGIIQLAQMNVENKIVSNLVKHQKEMKELKYELNSDIADEYEIIDEWFGGSDDEE